MINNPKVSVLMGVYNCEKTVEEAIDSIRNQTYENWELIICDDGSIDNTCNIVERIADKDSRIILIKNNTNLGLNKTLNNCLKIASGDYIARMDGDDRCSFKRFEKQVDFLNSQDEYFIVSTPMKFFDENGFWGESHTKNKPTSEDVVTGSPIHHAPVMMKKECLDTVNGYTEDKRMLRVEDVNLWIKLYAAGYKCFNLDESLYYMRNDKNALNRRKYKYRINSTYVRLLGCKMLRLNYKCYVKAFTPMIIGLVPAKLRYQLRRFQMRG